MLVSSTYNILFSKMQVSNREKTLLKLFSFQLPGYQISRHWILRNNLPRSNSQVKMLWSRANVLHSSSQFSVLLHREQTKWYEFSHSESSTPLASLNSKPFQGEPPSEMKSSLTKTSSSHSFPCLPQVIRPPGSKPLKAVFCCSYYGTFPPKVDPCSLFEKRRKGWVEFMSSFHLIPCIIYKDKMAYQPPMHWIGVSDQKRGEHRNGA